MAFRVLIIGGTGQVGAAVVRALAAEPSCAEIVMVNRSAMAHLPDPRVRQVILDTASAQFPAEVTRLAQSLMAQGDPVYGACCVGVGKGSLNWSEAELKALEIGVVGGFARGCRAGGITRFSLLSAVGSTAKSRRITYFIWRACRVNRPWFGCGLPGPEYRLPFVQTLHTL